MAVSSGYLGKIRRAVRRSSSADVDEELTDLVEECRKDLERVGVSSTKTNDEADSLILGAVRCFVRWKFGVSNEDSEKNKDDYLTICDELRKSSGYAEA